MTATFWAWFFGLYAAFASGLFLVVAIGSHQIIEGLKDRIDVLKAERDGQRFIQQPQPSRILDLIARNEASRFDPDNADWGA